jgi:hypothetical protein
MASNSGHRFVRCGLCVSDDCAPEDSAVFQIVYRFINLLERLVTGHQLIELQLAFAMPAHEQRKFEIRSALAAAADEANKHPL